MDTTICIQNWSWSCENEQKIENKLNLAEVMAKVKRQYYDIRCKMQKSQDVKFSSWLPLDLRLGAWDLGSGTWDLLPGTQDRQPGAKHCGLGPKTWDLGLWGQHVECARATAMSKVEAAFFTHNKVFPGVKG